MKIIETRASISPEVQEAVKLAIDDKYYATVTAVNLTNIDFTDEFEKSVEDKVIAEQQKEAAITKAEQELEVAKLTAQAKIVEAEGNAESQKIIARASAEAMALKIIELAKSTGFNVNETYLKRNPFTLSSGEKRKVAIASILIHDPEVIILDEPTIGLDNASKKNIIKTIKSLKTKYNKTVFVISKDTDLLLKICDYVVVLNKGQVVLEGNKYDVFTNKNLEDYGVKRPDIINFEMLALNKKKVKLGYRDEINDLMKDVYIIICYISIFNK